MTLPFKNERIRRRDEKASYLLRRHQTEERTKEVLEAVYEGRDCVAVLPTDFEKSVIFHIIPYLIPKPKTVIVVTPITALMEDQLQYLSDKEISACSISMDGTFYNTVSQEDSCIKTVSMNHFNIAYVMGGVLFFQ